MYFQGLFNFLRNTVPLKSLGRGFLCILCICFCVFGVRTIKKGGKCLILYGGCAIFIEKYIESTPKVLYKETTMVLELFIFCKITLRYVKSISSKTDSKRKTINIHEHEHTPSS
jgi:hypothetical protein